MLLVSPEQWQFKLDTIFQFDVPPSYDYKRCNVHLEQTFDKYTWLERVRFRYTILDDWRLEPFFFTQVIVLQLCCIIHEYLDIVSIMHIIDSRYITEITFHGCLHIFCKLYGIDKDSIIAYCMSMFCYFTRCSSEIERRSFKWILSHFPSISVAQSLYFAEGNKCALVAAIVAKNSLVDQRSRTMEIQIGHHISIRCPAKL